MQIGHRGSLSRGRRARATALLATLALGLTTGVVAAVPAQARTSDNPLLGTWGVYAGGQDGAYPAWDAAVGTTKTLLAKVALAPRARWYGSWMTPDKAASQVRADIRQEQGGDPDVLVPMAVFREFPWSERAIDRPLETADREAYKRWIDAVAGAIGDSRVLMILEPDLPLALKGWKPKVRLGLVSYAARVFGELPRTTTYLDAGAVDWLVDPADAVSLLRRSGIEHVQGFTVGGTHYSSTTSNLRYGAKIARGLDEAGVTGKSFVVETSDNGKPFTGVWYRKTHPNGILDFAEPCATPTQSKCVALGIPPTTDVTAPRWGLPDDAVAIAEDRVDAYVWFARPWLDKTKQKLDLARTLAISAASPY